VDKPTLQPDGDNSDGDDDDGGRLMQDNATKGQVDDEQQPKQFHNPLHDFRKSPQQQPFLQLPRMSSQNALEEVDTPSSKNSEESSEWTWADLFYII